jgi:hypothetical protein
MPLLLVNVKEYWVDYRQVSDILMPGKAGRVAIDRVYFKRLHENYFVQPCPDRSALFSGLPGLPAMQPPPKPINLPTSVAR